MTAYHIAMLLTSYCDYVQSDLVLSGLIFGLSYLLQASILSAITPASVYGSLAQLVRCPLLCCGPGGPEFNFL